MNEQQEGEIHHCLGVVHERKCMNFTSRTHYKDVVKRVLIRIVKNKRSKYDSYIIGDMIKVTKNSLIK